jgi:hypothetical protein
MIGDTISQASFGMLQETASRANLLVHIIYLIKTTPKDNANARNAYNINEEQVRRNIVHDFNHVAKRKDL